MKNQKEIYFFVIFTFITGGLFAQDDFFNRTFSQYSDYASTFNVTCKIPKNFIDLRHYEIWKIRHNCPIGLIFSPIIQSDDQECILMYSRVFRYISELDKQISKITQILSQGMSKNKTIVDWGENPNDKLPRNTIISQFRASFGQCDIYGHTNRDSIFNFDNYVRVIYGKKVRKSFNADSVFIYDIPLENTYKDKYIYSTGMIIAKKNRPYIQLWWLFTEEGKKKEEKYIETLSKKIWYNDNKQKDSKNDPSKSGGKNWSLPKNLISIL